MNHANLYLAYGGARTYKWGDEWTGRSSSIETPGIVDEVSLDADIDRSALDEAVASDIDRTELDAAAEAERVTALTIDERLHGDVEALLAIEVAAPVPAVIVFFESAIVVAGVIGMPEEGSGDSSAAVVIRIECSFTRRFDGDDRERMLPPGAG